MGALGRQLQWLTDHYSGRRPPPYRGRWWEDLVLVVFIGAAVLPLVAFYCYGWLGVILAAPVSVLIIVLLLLIP
jgi:hypothetical protein